MTLHQLASALRGLPRDAPMFVRLPDGSLRHIRGVRPVFLATAGGGEVPSDTSKSQTTYAISLEVGDG